MNKYYDQDNFKDDAFAGAKAFHKTFIKQFDEFDPIARRDYHYEWAACG